MSHVDIVNKDEILNSIFEKLIKELALLLNKVGYKIDISHISGRHQAFADQLDYVLSLFYSAKDRRLQPKKRAVKLSSVFHQKLSSGNVSANEQHAIQRIIELSLEGGDLSPYQSTGVSRLETRYQNQDKLFNDWNIMHFHTGIGKPAEIPGFVDRSSDLIICYPTPDCLYFVDFRPHGSETWLDRTLLDIIVSEWPSVLIPLPGVSNSLIQTPPSIVGAMRGETSKQKSAARKASALYTMNFIYLLELSNGKSYLPPGGGLAPNGMRCDVGLRSDTVIRNLRRWVSSDDLLRYVKERTRIVRKKITTHPILKLSLGLAIQNLWNVHIEIFDERTGGLLYRFEL